LSRKIQPFSPSQYIGLLNAFSFFLKSSRDSFWDSNPLFWPILFGQQLSSLRKVKIGAPKRKELFLLINFLPKLEGFLNPRVAFKEGSPKEGLGSLSN